MNYLISFKNNESGAVTVDWVVLTAAIVGIGMSVIAAVSVGVESASEEIDGGLEVASNFKFSFDSATTEWNGKSASDYIAEGQVLAPGNNGAVYGYAITTAQDDAPDGYNFNNPLHTGTNSIIYTSNDGQNYSIDGEVIAIADYEGAAKYYGV